MKERDAQIEFKKNNIKSDKKWEEQLKQNIEKAFQEENEKAIKRQKDRMALALFHLKQYVYINALKYLLFSQMNVYFYLVIRAIYMEIFSEQEKCYSSLNQK